MKKICQNCQAPNQSSAQFCDQCGSPLKQPEPFPPQSQNQLAGSAFNSPFFDKSPDLGAKSADVSNKKESDRPSFLPEQSDEPQYSETGHIEQSEKSYAKPSGVAYEIGAGKRDGRPISLPEQHEKKSSISKKPEFHAKGNRIVGEVREFRERHEPQGNINWIIWTFRVERYDKSGNQMQPVPVEMKGLKFEGTISEGDWVELPGQWKPGEIASPKKFINLTTGSEIRGSVPAGAKISWTCGWIMFAVFILAVIAFIIFLATS